MSLDKVSLDQKSLRLLIKHEYHRVMASLLILRGERQSNWKLGDESRWRLESKMKNCSPEKKLFPLKPRHAATKSHHHQNKETCTRINSELVYKTCETKLDHIFGFRYYSIFTMLIPYSLIIAFFPPFNQAWN